MQEENEMRLRANAKINLSLDVLGTRPDGYHEVRMVMQMTGMYDRLTLTPVKGREGIHLSVNLPYIPTGDSNLVVKAAKLLMERKGVTDGLDVELEKFIPVAAGLAGGSSDAAQTMIGVNRIFRLGYTRKELMELGKEIGADVPYCILQGTALSEGIGEVLTRLPGMPPCHILLCKPNINVSTKDVYQSFDALKTVRHPDVDGQIEALKCGDLAGIADPARMSNVLELVTADRYPVVRAIEQDMKRAGALQAVMSGSGPTVFGIFDDREKAEACRERLKKTRPSARTFLTWPQSKYGGKS
ncbi:MAG: 4-(cytidine 5'-diphospho)-2-C-methyl-D-erythritol kinase [Lachnospiraceae bacterium]|nr:4-(cytidine 5'-diphospho)-2-C-methyl-D-erythritol kinase [Lachnospiraceae bacterium]MCI1334226.1 4-(cytidine 5'-diphospho)-2-C-methyl-D-erythritol kinase [Lachnospiraceae bacterium]